MELFGFESKAAAYEYTIDCFLDALPTKNRKRGAKDAPEKLIRAKKMMMLWASPSALAAFSRLLTPTTDSHAMLLTFEELIREMRNDLGLGDDGLGAGRLVGLFLNDGGRTLTERSEDGTEG